MSNLRIGVIGCGGRGNVAGFALQSKAGARIVAGCSDYEPHLEAFKEKYGDDVYTCVDYQDIISRDDVDAVFITTPDFLHEEMAIAALEAGKPVYLEKPLAISIEGCDRILKAAYKTKTKLFLGHNMRHFESVLKMKEIIDSGQIGEIQAVWCRHFIDYGGDAYFKDWHSEKQYANSLLLQKGAHDIDVIHWLAGSYTERVVGMGKLSVYDQCARRHESERGDASFRDENWPPLEQTKCSPKIDIEDHNMIMMQLRNGIQCSYLQCHYTPDTCRNYTFIGTKGRLENIGDTGNSQIYVYTDRHSSFGTPNQIFQLFGQDQAHGGADPNIVDEFIRFVKFNDLTNTSPLAARNSVATGVLGAASLREGNVPKVIPELDPALVDYFENNQQW
ncbi:MAG: Gfo/Idh/MocA family oxidoreductase [Lentisphaeria bacterium]|nr:Gfo/Idh/MocA family oxidoreductase [Lentisphaeria bacterium]